MTLLNILDRKGVEDSFLQGMSMKKIATAYGISRGYVRHILHSQLGKERVDSLVTHYEMLARCKYLREPERCPTCGGLIYIVPCILCSHENRRPTKP